MNLYRSFGNLMEAWVAEGGQCSDSELLGNNAEAPPSPPANPRSESVDSGVEMASADMSFQAASDSTDNTDFAPGEGSPEASEPPALSCPLPPDPFSPCLSPGGSRAHSAVLHQKVEAALKRSNSKHLKDPPGCLTAAETPRRPQRYTSESLRAQRSDRLDLRTTFNPSQPTRLTRRRRSVTSDTLLFQRKLEDLGEEEAKRLSPGLWYLEHVCRRLEEFAEQQRHRRTLQREGNDPEEEVSRADEVVKGSQQAFGPHQTDSGAVDPSDRGMQNKSEGRSPGERRCRGSHRRHLRQRSVSDTNITTVHLRMQAADCRGQHLRTDDLLMEINEDLEKQETDGEKTNTFSRSWKSKIRSLTRHVSVLRDVNSQQTQPTEEKQARLRLSQLFKRTRTKTT